MVLQFAAISLMAGSLRLECLGQFLRSHYSKIVMLVSSGIRLTHAEFQDARVVRVVRVVLPPSKGLAFPPVSLRISVVSR